MLFPEQALSLDTGGTARQLLEEVQIVLSIVLRNLGFRVSTGSCENVMEDLDLAAPLKAMKRCFISSVGGFHRSRLNLQRQYQQADFVFNVDESQLWLTWKYPSISQDLYGASKLESQPQLLQEFSNLPRQLLRLARFVVMSLPSAHTDRETL